MRLARKQGRLATVPEVDLPTVNNTRTGFFEETDYRAVLEALKGRADLQVALTIGYLTSWRINEVFGLKISDINFDRKTLSIATSKNGEGRVFPFKGLPELEDALRGQRGRAIAFQMRHGRESVGEWLFPCPQNPGQRWARPDRAFKPAFKTAGVPDRLFHDLRRTAIRNFDRHGISRNVAMKLSGHKTESIYNRYRIVNEDDLVEGVAKLGVARAAAAK
jgi:integrase